MSTTNPTPQGYFTAPVQVGEHFQHGYGAPSPDWDWGVVTHVYPSTGRFDLLLNTLLADWEARRGPLELCAPTHNVQMGYCVRPTPAALAALGKPVMRWVPA